ncbi:winged helix-turn-helix transcriptional regulator [Methanobrevibacter olleyae]|uniref:HxlR family transcriptional regulator n=1 Tax=Methanobrevibacter olleyae TaxID=294671 RepID=A0A126R171_METOL|nr:helix-turn-helix domain-containing protein [Methanobrevibacter olleyae]AMK16133.1 HxlR family transcriptional regulator [Methanobrevibacter olleyae]SFL32306.1 transcriptional regulator, HxlR family [Methanobrevibacter olleyae]
MVEEKAKKCPVELAMGLINKKWVIQLLRDMFFGVSRFNEFKEDKPNLSNKVLSNCLKEMEYNGLIQRIVDDEDPLNIEYKLTEKGLALNKVIYELVMFSLTTDIDNEYYSEEDKTEIAKIFEKQLFG